MFSALDLPTGKYNVTSILFMIFPMEALLIFRDYLSFFVQNFHHQSFFSDGTFKRRSDDNKVISLLQKFQVFYFSYIGMRLGIGEISHKLTFRRIPKPDDFV